MKRVLISGGSGMVGTALTSKLVERGFDVHHLSRDTKKTSDAKVFGWDVNNQEIDIEAFNGVTSIVHLAGAGITDKPWTDKRKKVIIDSRVETAKLLLKGLKASGQNIHSFISASGINYYGSKTTAHIFKETDPPSRSFIGECCVKWEAAADEFKSQARVVQLRTGVVLSKDDGALKHIAMPVKLGFGAALGSGRQHFPYIHIDDLVNLYRYAIENEQLEGEFNAVNGDHITNKELVATLAKVLKKPYWLPNIPSMLLKLILGEMAELVLEGSRASAEKIKAAGFEFKYRNLEQTIKAIYNNH